MGRLIKRAALLGLETIDDYADCYRTLPIGIPTNPILWRNRDRLLFIAVHLPIRGITNRESSMIQLLEIAAGGISSLA